MITALLNAWRWLLALPKWLKLSAAAVALSGTVYAFGLHTVRSIQEHERSRIYARADSLHGVAMDSLRRALVDSLRKSVAVAVKQDSAVARATTRVRAKVKALTPESATRPDVAALASASTDLANNADAMRETIRHMTGLTERFIGADSITVQALKVTVVQYQDRVRVLEKRLPWWKAALGGIGTAAIGFAIGAIGQR